MLTTDRANPIADQVPRRFRDARLADLAPERRAAIESAIGHRLGVVLFGPTGRGKTHALAAIANDARLQRKPGDDYAERWISWLDFLDDILRASKLRGDDAYRFDPVRWAVRQQRMIYLDDVGAEPEGLLRTIAIEKLPLIVDERYRRDHLVSITTNLSPLELEQRYGIRTTSRLYSMCQWLEFGGDDLRLARKESA